MRASRLRRRADLRRLPAFRPGAGHPLALLSRNGLPLWREIAPAADPSTLEPSAGARAVYELLQRRGACFFGEIAHGAGLLHTQLEMALAELVTWGLVTSDSFTGLRALLTPAHKRPPVDRMGRGPSL